MTDADANRLRAALAEIRGHLGACIVQRAPSDDRIIAEHIEDAYKIAKDAEEACGPHYHVSGNMIGRPADECAKCGRDIRDEIHSSRRMHG